MKITHAAILSTCSLLLAGVNARLGTRMTGRAGIIDPSVDEFVPDDEYVISFNDPDDGDTFRSMSQTFTRVSGRVEVHSMLKNLNMATARVKPEVSCGCGRSQRKMGLTSSPPSFVCSCYIYVSASGFR